eukprot:gnl/TRDRNA2_/TRDRNA2_126129_c0_seq1.p1 gnl/TRDRNA2_/TRDRNA2_126129_c0~~gnl/TRDRNA2_/TRDRNA2_126129_c0_seq1.p1  ORF type:complete len:383 (+),score=53.19 gnl/TRDRNA2_/TRDRNA2_126129_c0_seq1:100-1149(+)
MGSQDETAGEPSPQDVSPVSPVELEEEVKPPATPEPTPPASKLGIRLQLLFCFVGLQASYLTWGYVQEKIMTKEYENGRFPSATFCVFSNRVFAIFAAAVITLYRHGTLRLPATPWSFAPCSISNSLSSYSQYEALRFVSFPLQTLSKSTKVIPVMLMGILLNKKSYPLFDYLEALAIAAGVSMFSLGEKSGKKEVETQLVGVLLLALYIASDSFTSQWQSRVFKAYPKLDQYQMMYATNMWSIILTLTALGISGEFWSTIVFLQDNPSAIVDNFTIAVTSATGQLFIFYTIKQFGPVAFTIIMTTRQVVSMVLSTILFAHPMTLQGYAGTAIVFGAAFYRAYRQSSKK